MLTYATQNENRVANPLPFGEPYAIVEGTRGLGHYVGTGMGVECNNDGWWCEGRTYPGWHDMSSVPCWYQTLLTAPSPGLPDRNALKVV